MSAMLEQPMTVTLRAAEWLVFLGWLSGVAPEVSGPAEDVIEQLIVQLPEILAALKIER